MLSRLLTVDVHITTPQMRLGRPKQAGVPGPSIVALSEAKRNVAECYQLLSEPVLLRQKNVPELVLAHRRISSPRLGPYSARAAKPANFAEAGPVDMITEFDWIDQRLVVSQWPLPAL